MSKQRLHEQIATNSRILAGALTTLNKALFAQADVKTLRSFSAQETAELLGVSHGYVRKLLSDGRIHGELAPGNRRVFTAEAIRDIRLMLAEEAKDPNRFRPGRRSSDDHLQVIAYTTFKGGATKTTSAIHVAQRLALRGYRVLTIDCDPQASLSTYYGYQPEIDFLEGGTLYDAIRYRDSETGEERVPLSSVIKKTYFPGLDLVPGGVMLAEFEHETPRALSQFETPIFFERVASALEEIDEKYDVVILDCPPALGYLTLSALCASTSVVMPIIPDRVDIASASQFLQMTSNLLGVLADRGAKDEYDWFRFQISRNDPAFSTHAYFTTQLRQMFGEQVLKSEFVKSAEVSNAGLESKTIWEIEPAKASWRTRARIVEAATAVTDEIQELIQESWGRK